MLNEKPKLFKVITWKIFDCSQERFQDNTTRKSIKSQAFRLDLKDAENNSDIHADLFLELYPNGNIEEYHGNLGIYLHTIAAKPNKTVKFSFAIGPRKKCLVKPLHEFFKSGWGYAKLISHAELFNPSKNHIVDGILTIRCEISEVDEKKPPASANILNDQMVSEITKMFENESLTDFEVEANDGEILKVHKFILAARSPVFFAMLTRDMKEQSENLVSVPDFNSKVLRELFRFLYCNKVEFSSETLSGLIYAADKYNIGLLKELCFDRFISTLEFKNVPAALMIAHEIEGSDDLYEECLKLILSDIDQIVKDVGWKELPHEVITQVLVDFCKRAPETFVQVKTAEAATNIQT